MKGDVRRESSEAPSVAVIVLNWNCWPDTLECLESLFRLKYPSFEVVVCDNASTDGSVERIGQWASNELCILPASRAMAGFVLPPVVKPSDILRATEKDRTPRLTLIQSPSNLGYAAGNNLGLSWALERKFDYAWILNADTVVDPDALDALIARMSTSNDAGLCGSLLCYYDAPSKIQEAGGCEAYPLIGLSRRLASDQDRNFSHPWRRLEARMGYISGASCLVSRSFLEDVGLMSEDYFLYCEEIDWATRARGLYTLSLAEKSLVYHKKGLSTGSKAVGRSRSASSSYYLWRARRRFTQRYHPLGLVSLFGLGIAASTARALSGDVRAAKSILAGVLDRTR